MNARVKGPQPQSRTPNHSGVCLLSLNLVRSSISNEEWTWESPAGNSGGRWETHLSATPRTSLPNRSKVVAVATVYSVNSFGIPWIQSLLKPLPQSCTGDESAILSAQETQTDSTKSPQQDYLDEAIGKLSLSEKEAFMEVFKAYANVCS